ncbi:hypothetical protein V1478_005307 [Vespula squamosa]|uniref:Uncharacterized protein n=1 Tax=Vespula squamosa TaxID=30214 RepID=A0ABD2BDS9_VESSQ
MLEGKDEKKKKGKNGYFLFINGGSVARMGVMGVVGMAGLMGSEILGQLELNGSDKHHSARLHGLNITLNSEEKNPKIEWSCRINADSLNISRLYGLEKVGSVVRLNRLNPALSSFLV